ncbi:MAG: putative addiction module component (TIGR02574 family) [Candidatus Binatia bacterium]|jgi:putative addiction module component (TIGR02574 family)
MEAEALRLPVAERVRLVESLMDSLDDDATKEIDAAWAEEAESRLAAVRSGKLKTVDGPSSLAEARKRLSA